MRGSVVRRKCLYRCYIYTYIHAYIHKYIDASEECGAAWSEESASIDVTVAHTAPTVDIKVSTDLNAALGDVDEWWGVGNVTLSYQDELRTTGMCVCMYVCVYVYMYVWGVGRR